MMTRKMGLTWAVALVGFMVFAVSTAIGSPRPVGWLLGSRNATLDGQAALPNTAVLSGDNLQVGNGLAMVTLDQGNRMVMGRETEASFLKEADAVSVSLTHGALALYHPQASQPFRVKVGDVTVAPARGLKTMGEVAMVDGLLVVTAKDGALEVEKGGTTQEVTNGKTITLATTAARAPTPVPPRRHLKHILFPESQEGPSHIHITQINPWAVAAILGAIGAGTAVAVITLTGPGPSASPVTP